MKNLITIEEFLELKNKKNNFVLLDCRFSLSDKEYGIRSYNEKHIEGAVYVDLEKDMTGKVAEHGGRHPLPDLESFKERMNSMGVEDDSLVIIYDDGDLAAASRLWWLFKYIGKEKVMVLEEGLNGWIKKGLTVTSQPGEIKTKAGELTLNKKEDIFVPMEYVKNNLGNKDILIIDSREKDRYLGLVEPVDKKAGHIPGAKNYFWKDSFDELKVKDKDVLIERLKFIDKEKEIIVHCGSGITGCVNVLILEEMGIESKLYAGSWSDWISYDDNPVAVGEE